MKQIHNLTLTTIKPTALAASALIFISGIGVAQAEPQMDEDNSAAAAASALGEQDIVEIASNAEDFSTLVAAIKAAGLDETLKGEGPFTIFAPTNAAFERIPEETLLKLMEPAAKAKLVEILSYHVVPEKLMAADLSPMTIKTAEGREATVTVDGAEVMVDGAKVTKADVEASNGVIHVIDKVLMPPMAKDDASEE